MAATSSPLLDCFFCCQQKDHFSETDAEDGGIGGTPGVYKNAITSAPTVKETGLENEFLQHPVESPYHQSPEQATGLQDATPPTHLNVQPLTSSLPNQEIEMLYEKRIQDLEDELNLVLRRNKELSLRVCELEDLMCPEVEKKSWVESRPSNRLKEQFGKSLKEKREQERRALKAEEHLRDLKHQNAVLQKRLHQAECSSPGHSSLPPVPQPLPPGSIGPMFSLLRNATAKRDPPISQETTDLSGAEQENENTIQHSPDTMNEVLEKIRSGVLLRPVYAAQKSAVTLVATVQPNSPVAVAKSPPSETLAEDQMDAPEALDEPSTSVALPGPTSVLLGEIMEKRIIPDGEDLSGSSASAKQENHSPDRGFGDVHGSGRSTDDEGSTSSTLPVTSNHSTDEDDEDPELGISNSEKTGDTNKLLLGTSEGPCILGVDHVSLDNGDWRGSHRQVNSEGLAHAETLGNKISVEEISIEESASSDVFMITVVSLEQSLQETGNEDEPDQKFSFTHTDCINKGFTGFFQPASHACNMGPVCEGTVNDGSSELKTHIADILSIETGDISEDNQNISPGTCQNKDCSDHLGTEKTISPHHNTPHDKSQEIDLGSLASAMVSQNKAVSEEDTESSLEHHLAWNKTLPQVLGRISPTKYSVHPKPASPSEPDKLPPPLALEMLPIIGLAQDELQPTIEQSVALEPQRTEDDCITEPTIIEVSLVNERAVLQVQPLEGTNPVLVDGNSPSERDLFRDGTESFSDTGFF